MMSVMIVRVCGGSRFRRQRARLFIRRLEGESDNACNDHEYC